LGGSACGYQELFAALAIPTTTGQAGGEPYIYTLLHLVRTPAFAADRVFLDCRGAGILVRHARCTGRALLTVKLVAVHDAGREREPGQDAWMPPRLEEGLRDDRVPGDPGRSRAEGRTPARDHPADLDAGRRPGPRNVAAGLAGAVQAGGPQEGATARHVPALSAVTLSHAEGHGEHAHCRRSVRGRCPRGCAWRPPGKGRSGLRRRTAVIVRPLSSLRKPWEAAGLRRGGAALASGEGRLSPVRVDALVRASPAGGSYGRLPASCPV
jgi:hypothetical protein